MIIYRPFEKKKTPVEPPRKNIMLMCTPLRRPQKADISAPALQYAFLMYRLAVLFVGCAIISGFACIYYQFRYFNRLSAGIDASFIRVIYIQNSAFNITNDVGICYDLYHNTNFLVLRLH